MMERQGSPSRDPDASAPVFAEILCAIDGKPGGFVAVEQAAQLAGPRGHLTLLAVTSFRSEGTYRSPALPPAQVTDILRRAERIADDAGVPWTVEVDPASPPAEVILGWSVRYDLLALGAPASSWLGGMFIEGVGDAAVGVLTSPVLVARPIPDGRRFADRIVVASDGLAGSDELVELAGQLGRAAGAHVTLLHATGHEPPLMHHRIADHQRTLEEQERRLGAMAASELRIGRGGAHELIVATARSAGASLVMMGSRGLEGLRAIGSVGRRVTHEAPCSVLLVPPERLLRSA